MKKLILSSFLLLGIALTAQTNCNQLKKKNESLKSLNENLTSENNYLKEVLNINKPILKLEKDSTQIKVTKVVGNSKDKTISITLLLEAKNENKNLTLDYISIIDLEGEQYNLNFFKSSSTYPKLTKDVPLKVKFTFSDIINKPLIIKLLKFKVRTAPESDPNMLYPPTSMFEFRDLNVIWD
ncbi:transposase [Weeksellaceae bacterium TAE3-ERU29]|nr:transposase [Weeksellaceae bacterium TAE3-ERU29]